MCLAAGVLCACGSDDAGGGPTGVASTTALSFASTLDAAPAEAADARVLWSVSSGQPDYLYAWGRAAVQDRSFTLTLSSRPPAEALNSYGLGVGLLVIAPRSLDVPDGVLSDDSDSLLAELLGASDRHAIIYVDHAQADAALQSLPDAGARARDHWLFDFPPGYSCGEAREAAPGETFDYYVPVDCSALEARLGDLDTFDFPNWT